MMASSMIPPRTPPTMATIFERLPPPEGEDAPAGRDEGLLWDEMGELELMVDPAVGVEEVLVELELEPLVVSPGPISGLSDERTCEAAEKEGGEEDPYHRHTSTGWGPNRSLADMCH